MVYCILTYIYQKKQLNVGKRTFRPMDPMSHDNCSRLPLKTISHREVERLANRAPKKNLVDCRPIHIHYCSKENTNTPTRSHGNIHVYRHIYIYNM